MNCRSWGRKYCPLHKSVWRI